MDKIGVLEQELEKIKDRNKRVEADKAWETSWTRRALIFVVTYAAIAVYFHFAGLPDPLANSFVPAFAFVISVSSLGLFKNLWLEYVYKG